MYLLDTDVLVDIQRGHTPAIAWFASLTTLPSVPGFKEALSMGDGLVRLNAPIVPPAPRVGSFT